MSTFSSCNDKSSAADASLLLFMFCKLAWLILRIAVDHHYQPQDFVFFYRRVCFQYRSRYWWRHNSANTPSNSQNLRKLWFSCPVEILVWNDELVICWSVWYRVSENIHPSTVFCPTEDLFTLAIIPSHKSIAQKWHQELDRLYQAG